MDKELGKVIPELQQVSLEGMAGVTALAELLSIKGLISIEEYKSLKEKHKDEIIKILDK